MRNGASRAGGCSNGAHPAPFSVWIPGKARTGTRGGPCLPGEKGGISDRSRSWGRACQRAYPLGGRRQTCRTAHSRFVGTLSAGEACRIAEKSGNLFTWVHSTGSFALWNGKQPGFYRHVPGLWTELAGTCAEQPDSRFSGDDLFFRALFLALPDPYATHSGSNSHLWWPIRRLGLRSAPEPERPSASPSASQGQGNGQKRAVEKQAIAPQGRS